ncbi:CPBP family intramembrane glutamic endopeptidase [Crocosphaera sp. XPORK-15E]|uniref:CPBP family intramembrane glutamic endopeptidase n=1 Tax=Crocosphaera sp. XPORK-15E TaxID=3110247 RepID=UPI002B1FBB60|nr:CPBP family intramembrane glutamic endopeptidase [Crocosphaera sp. XPORK-15E]MEA5535895.1 CPBP family intramembrane glutamic endopeptidase [Crocosphaera sp. XPORK-15E]
MKLLSSSQITIFVVIIFLYILPVVLLLTKVIPFGDRFLVLTITGVSIIGLALINKIPFVDLGFNHQNLLPAIKNILPVTITSSVLMIAFYLKYGMRIDNTSIPWYFYVFYISLSSPLQEFLYRSYLFNRLTQIQVNQYSIIITSILYSFAHSIYQDLLTVLLSLIIGLYWGYHYNRFKNLYSITFSHTILGIVAILTGIL